MSTGTATQLDLEVASSEATGPLVPTVPTATFAKVSRALKISGTFAATALAAKFAIGQFVKADEIRETPPISAISSRLDSTIENEHLLLIEKLLADIFSVASGIMFASATLIYLQQKLLFLRQRICKEKITFLVGELAQACRNLEQAQREMEESVERHKSQVDDLEGHIQTLKGERDTLNDQILVLQTQLDSKVAEAAALITQLQGKDAEIAHLKQLSERFDGYEDATVLASAANVSAKMAELARSFHVEIEKLVTDGPKRGVRLMFAVNPDLQDRIEAVRTELSLLVSTWLNDELPEEEKAFNKTVLAPFLEKFESVERLFKAGRFVDALEEVIGLAAVIQYLVANSAAEESNANEFDPTSFESPQAAWAAFQANYKSSTGHAVSSGWLDAQGMLLNFFDVLGLVFEDDYAWSEESYREIIKPSYKRMSREYHPDKNPGDSEAAEKFRWIAEANTVLSDENKANEYLTLLRIYRKIFPNHS